MYIHCNFYLQNNLTSNAIFMIQRIQFILFKFLKLLIQRQCGPKKKKKRKIFFCIRKYEKKNHPSRNTEDDIFFLKL